MEIDSFSSRPLCGSEEHFEFDRPGLGQGLAPVTQDTEVGHNVQDVILHYQSFLRGRCRTLVRGNRDDANDLFSQVMLKVCTEPPQRLREIRHIGGWLNRIAYNQFIDDQRERQALERRDDNLGYFYETVGHQSPSPEQEFLNDELDRHIRSAFEALPDRLWRAAHLRFYEGAPYEEIAAELNISQANARKRIQEARKILASHLRRYLAGSGEPHGHGDAR